MRWWPWARKREPQHHHVFVDLVSEPGWQRCGCGARRPHPFAAESFNLVDEVRADREDINRRFTDGATTIDELDTEVIRWLYAKTITILTRSRGLIGDSPEWRKNYDLAVDLGGLIGKDSVEVRKDLEYGVHVPPDPGGGA